MEAGRYQVQLINKGFNHSHRVIFTDEAIQALWQQRDLLPVLNSDIYRHVESPIQHAYKLLSETNHTEDEGYQGDLHAPHRDLTASMAQVLDQRAQLLHHFAVKKAQDKALADAHVS